jgi:hypothetical protein
LKLKGVHLLLTYQCDRECDHCFVWGSPDSRGVFTIQRIKQILAEAEKLGTVDHVSLEGGEPFLYYPIMIRAIEEATILGFGVEVLSNCYWASCPEDAVEWLRPMSEAGDVALSLSSDPYHGESWKIEEVATAVKAAKSLDMEANILSIKYPEADTPCPGEIEGVKVGLSELMYKGRAASELTGEAERKVWSEFTECPYEELENPGRVHVDPLGYVHVCQGISIGNAWRRPFSEIVGGYDPHGNPIIGPLIRGGPAALVESFRLLPDESYADACHLCYSMRLMLREKHPDILGPDQMYGEFE